MLQTERAPVRLEGARGPLSAAESKAILQRIAARSPDSDILARHVAIEEALAGNPLSIGNKVTLIEDGPRTYASMLAAFKAAKNHIHIETYIFEDDEVGTQFAAALAERARAGLKVRVIYDSVGSIHTSKEFFARLREAGVEVVEFNPLGTSVLTGAFDHRDHRKLTIVDGRIAYLGGINISSVYGTSSSAARPKQADVPFEKRPWRDTQVKIEGPVVADLQRAFLDQWARQTKTEAIGDKRYFPPIAPQGSLLVRAMDTSPSKQGLNAAYVTLISAIQNAEKDVRITNAYFVPHEELMGALTDAARRGVDVRMILPSRTDNWLVIAAGRSYYDALLESGVKIYERKERLLHSKTATIDGVWSTVGSTNLDWRSLASNDELNAVVLGPEFAAQMNALFDKDLANSTQITLEDWRSRGLGDRLRESAARAWARLL
jgi:cardiolipin synthase